MAQQQPAGLRSETRGQESAASLVGRLVDDVTALVRNEVALAKAELAEAVASIRIGMGEFAFGAGLLLTGILALAAAIILALSEVIAPWLAALIVGVVLALGGILLLNAARKKLSPSALKPERTRESLRRDVQVVARRTP
jgi:hypothetical protein